MEENGEVEVEKIYSCKFCSKNFNNWQAYGGHQNAHRRERAAIKQLQREAELLAMPPPLPRYPLNPFTAADNRHQAMMFPQHHQQTDRFNSTSYIPSHSAHYPYFAQQNYFPNAPTPLQHSSQHILLPPREVIPGVPAAFSSSSSNMTACMGCVRPYPFGGGMRIEDDQRGNYGNYEYGTSSRAGPAMGDAMRLRQPSMYMTNQSSNGSAGTSQNELDLNLHL